MVARESTIALPSAPVPAPPARALEHVPTVEYIPTLELSTAREGALAADPKSQAASASRTSPALPLAGGFLLLNAVLHLFEFLFLPSVSMEASLRSAQLAGTLVGVGLDALLGISFLLGKTRFRTLAFARLVVGMFVFGGMSLYQAQYLFTLVVVAFSCGVLVLVWGNPSSLLAGVGLTAVLLSLGVEGIGFTRLAAAMPLSERAKIALRPDLEGRRLDEDDSIVGDRHPYKLRVPSDGWYRRKAELARSADSSIDVWLSHPDHHGQLMVSVRSWKEADAADLREARDQELHDLQTQYADFQVLDTSDNGPQRKAPSLATFSGSASRGGKPFQFEVSVYKTGDLLLRVTAFAPTPAFEALHLRGATKALRP